MSDIVSVSYTSVSLIGNDYEAIVDIWERSQRNNEKLDVTGTLYFTDNEFFQVLEGETGVVRELMKTIAADERHSNVATVFEFYCASRMFSNWSMKVVSGFKEARLASRFRYETLCEASPNDIGRLQEILRAA
ncbi:MAG: BLUF domain-containing protein [Pseudomonadota bacterium]